jgi:hypothetical protein
MNKPVLRQSVAAASTGCRFGPADRRATGVFWRAA